MISVALDTGPLYGSMTGVGRAVAGILDEFRSRTADIDVLPYVISRRAHLRSGSRRLPYPASLALSLWARADHPRVDRHLRPAQIVHGTNYVVPPTRLPRLVSVYDTWALRNPSSCSHVVNRAMSVLRRNIASGAVVHASSHATAQELLDIFPSASIHVVHLGAPRPRSIDPRAPKTVDATLRRLTGSDVPYVLVVGTIERRKNLPRFIDAYARTTAARSGLRLVIAGSAGDDITDVTASIERLDPQMRKLVILLGRVSESDLEDLYTSASALAYPSLDEGFGFPILEAMAHGVPVLGSNRGSIPEIAGDAAVLVDPMGIDAMASALDRVTSDDSLRRALSENGRTRCARFSWAKTADDLIALYRSVALRSDAA